MRWVLGVVALLLVPVTAAASDLSRRPIPEDKRWRSYVLDQHGGVVYALRTPTTITNATVVLDLGINTGGYVEVGVKQLDGRIHLGYSEARRLLTPDGDTGVPIKLGVPLVTDPSLGNDDDPNGRQDDITAAGAWRSPGVRGAQRWISLQVSGSATIDYVRVRETHLLPTVKDYTGHFLSSDDQLNRIWYASAYTFALDSFKDLRPGHDRGNVVVTDGAKRDRLVWLGDLAIENLLGGYALRQAPRIVRDSLQMFSCQQATDGLLPQSSQIATTCPDTPPAPRAAPGSVLLPEYTASWVLGLHGYHLLTGDNAFARRMLPVARRALAHFTHQLNGNGLYATPLVAINWHPFDLAGGEDAHTNATIFRALLGLAALERRVGSGERANAAARDATTLRNAMLARLWDAGAGAFLLNGLDPQRNHTQDAQVEAVLGGAISGQRAMRALRFLSTRLQTKYGTKNGELDSDPFMSNYISPFISSTELLARLHVGDAAGALDLMRRLWGHMVDTDPHSTVWEKLTFNGEPAGYGPNQIGVDSAPSNSVLGRGISSLAHGWAGGPVPALSGYVLGVRPVTPGFATWTIEPQLGDLRFAQGAVPTPRGPIVSRWRRGSKRFVLTVAAPRGTRGDVIVPDGAGRTIAMDGKVVWRRGRRTGCVRARRDGDAVRFSGLTGRHTFAYASSAARR